MSKRKVSYRVEAGEVVETVETSSPCVVLWSDLLAACKWSYDDGCGFPSDEMDGFEHEIRLRGDFPECAEVDDMHGFHIPNDWRGKASVVVVEGSDPWGVGAFASSWGASKQVAAERAAANKRATIDTIRKWREHGSEWEFCSCEFLDASASVGGILDADSDYRREVENELCDEVAGELESRGHIIEGRPEAKSRRVVNRTWSSGVNAFNVDSRSWRGPRYRKWVKTHGGRRPPACGDVKGGAV